MTEIKEIFLLQTKLFLTLRTERINKNCIQKNLKKFAKQKMSNSDFFSDEKYSSPVHTPW